MCVRPGRAERGRRRELLVALVEPVDVARRAWRARVAIARPTWPAPCSCRWNSGAVAGQRASAAASSGAKRSVTAPPQHWPSDGPSAKCRSLAARLRRARASRAPRRSPSARGGRRRSCRRVSLCGHQHARAGLARRRARASATTSTTTASAAFALPGDGEIADRPVDHGALPACTARHRAQDRLARRRRGERRVDAMPAGRRDRVADREEHRERQQQRRLAGRLAAMDGVGDVAALQRRTSKTGGQSFAVGIL